MSSICLYLKCLSDKDITAELNGVYGDLAKNKTHVYFSIGMSRRGRNDLNDLVRSGRPKDDNANDLIYNLIQNQLESDPHD